MPLELRRATESDLSFFFELRNDKTVRESSFHSDPLVYEDHYRWFHQKLQQKDAWLFVIMIDDRRVGQIRIDRHSSKYPLEVDVTLTRGFRGMGYGSEAISKACKIVFESRNDISEIFAHVLPSNRGSLRSFEKAGFKKIGLVFYENTDCIRMALPRE